jgi:hypothetical protein
MMRTERGYRCKRWRASGSESSIKRLHTYRTLALEQAGLNKKTRFAALLQNPLADSNRRPLLTMEVLRR